VFKLEDREVEKGLRDMKVAISSKGMTRKEYTSSMVC
jgi:hypothetical protein